MRRRAPTAAPTPEPTPQPSTTPGQPAQAVPAAPRPQITPGTQIMVAVSDAQAADVRPLQYKWKPADEEAMLAKMKKLALAQLPRENAQLNEGSLKNVNMRSFDLDLSNDAVVVLSAEVP